MRADLLVSGAVHALIVLALVLVRPVSTITISGPDAVQVAIVDASSLPNVRPAPAPPEPAPLEEEGVRIEKKPKEKPREPKPEPPKPRPEPPREKPPVTPPAAGETAPALPYARTGVPGLSAQVAVDDGDFAFAYYLGQVRRIIAGNWTAPAGVPAGTQVVVRFRIGRDGSVRDARVETGSGNSWFDQSALRAVAITRRLPPLPEGYGASDLGVHFGFEYTGN